MNENCVIDSHRHFWHYTDEEFGWIADDSLRRDFLPKDCSGMDPCIAVEARQSIEETHFLLDLARETSFIKGVVGWLPLASPEFPQILADFSDPKLVAMRHVVQDEPDDEFILRKEFIRAVGHLLKEGYAYDILVFERHLANTMKFVDALPDDSRLVLDHLGKPKDFNSWRKLMKELAKRENLKCKLSGLVTEINDISYDAARPYLEEAIEAFTPKRLMFGSDWPVVTAHMPYSGWRSTVEKFAIQLTAEERESIMHKTAEEFYLARH